MINGIKTEEVDCCFLGKHSFSSGWEPTDNRPSVTQSLKCLNTRKFQVASESYFQLAVVHPCLILKGIVFKPYP